CPSALLWVGVFSCPLVGTSRVFRCWLPLDCLVVVPPAAAPLALVVWCLLLPSMLSRFFLPAAAFACWCSHPLCLFRVRGGGVVVGVFGLVGCWWGRGALWGVGGTCSACSACVASSTSSAGSLFSLPRFHAVDVASFTGSACSTGNTCNPRKGRFWVS